MPLHNRSIAVSIAVICFFCLSFVGWLSGLPPFTCCKRALSGVVIAYLVTNMLIKAINVILTNAMITSHLNKQKDKTSAGAD